TCWGRVFELSIARSQAIRQPYLNPRKLDPSHPAASLADLLHQLVHGRGDAVFDIARPAEGGAAVFVEVGATFIASLFPHAARGNVGDHVIRVAADPGAF